jgi:2-iminobutanoate/2-iminopropanoate deaminase
MTHRAIQTSSAPSPVAGAYSQAVDTGGYVCVAGQVGRDPSQGKLVDGVEAQTEQVLKNMSAILDAAGLTLNDLVKTTCFLADIADYDVFNSIYVKFMGDAPPARSTFAVAALPRGARVEIEAIAVRSGD